MTFYFCSYGSCGNGTRKWESRSIDISVRLYCERNKDDCLFHVMFLAAIKDSTFVG